jgi:hypothetical protein
MLIPIIKASRSVIAPKAPHQAVTTGIKARATANSATGKRVAIGEISQAGSPKSVTALRVPCRTQATLSLCNGKSAFFNGDTKTAVKCLTEANVFFNSRKVALVIQILPIAPRFLLRLYNLRDRFVFKSSTKFN